MSEDKMRAYMYIIKRNFLGYKEPKLEIPPDSVIERSIREIEHVILMSDECNL